MGPACRISVSWASTRAGGLWALGFGVRGRVWLPVASLGFLAFPLVLSPSVLGRLAASFNPVGYALLIPVCLRSSHACIVRSRYCVGSYCSAGAGLAGVRFVEPVHASLLARGDPRWVCCARMGIPVGWLCPGTWVGSRRVWVSGCGAGSWGVRPVGGRRALLIWRAVGRVSRGVALCPGAWIWWGPALVCASYLWWDRPVVALRRRDCRRLRELVLFLSVFFCFLLFCFCIRTHQRVRMCFLIQMSTVAAHRSTHDLCTFTGIPHTSLSVHSFAHEQSASCIIT